MLNDVEMCWQTRTGRRGELGREKPKVGVQAVGTGCSGGRRRGGMSSPWPWCSGMNLARQRNRRSLATGKASLRGFSVSLVRSCVRDCQRYRVCGKPREQGYFFFPCAVINMLPYKGWGARLLASTDGQGAVCRPQGGTWRVAVLACPRLSEARALLEASDLVAHILHVGGCLLTLITIDTFARRLPSTPLYQRSLP